ncbi:hypothetical protein F3Y22_tig00110569pilonHSYRG00258 [Hibiscus syriacus]|uniref:HHO5-like N-terminal domain-containing protein n=1 Tax=Hibiscus syriacus TaxID=106335 RepID=A0A6A3A7W4_HIBSY|nr:hypothetical protein F3Y22_tig00110569pilonHSYRG00258 [Hibiscus syriacus]
MNGSHRIEYPSTISEFVYVPKTISEFVEQVSKIEDGFQGSSKISDFVRRLEDEMKKINCFKRELPLCMLLLKDGIERLKVEENQRKGMDEGKKTMAELGGSQAATPKQIKQLMRVDGLANDEVKSHSQASRLALVLFGTDLMKSRSDSPQGPLMSADGDSIDAEDDEIPV